VHLFFKNKNSKTMEKETKAFQRIYTKLFQLTKATAYHSKKLYKFENIYINE